MGTAQRFQKSLPMVRQKIALLLIAGAVLILLTQFSASASAATGVTLHGITVTPAIEYIKLKQNQDSTSFITTVTNNTPDKVLLTPTTRDFTASTDGRKLTFIKSNESSSNTHGLSDSIQVSVKDEVLNPGQSVKIPVSIVNANSLAPGGHYAAVIYGVKGIGGANKNIVSVREAVSCLVFLNTFSGGTQDTSVAAFPTANFTTALPQSANIVLANNGNTQTVPRGYVQITGPTNKTVAQGIINVDSSMILPDSKRLFPVALSSHGNRSLFGVFHEKLYYRHDGQEKYNVIDKKFYYVNVALTVATFAVLILLCAIFYFVIKFVIKKLKRKPKKPIPKKLDPPKRPPRKSMDIIN